VNIVQICTTRDFIYLWKKQMSQYPQKPVVTLPSIFEMCKLFPKTCKGTYLETLGFKLKRPINSNDFLVRFPQDHMTEWTAEKIGIHETQPCI
jgi:hypothetical protein